MFLKQFICKSCGAEFEAFTHEGELPICEKCGSKDVALSFSGKTYLGKSCAKKCTGNCKTCGGC